MGVGALFKADLVEWMTCMTYQAASGGGAQHMRELLTPVRHAQRRGARPARRPEVGDPRDRPQGRWRKQQSLSPSETAHFGVPLGGSLIPWIDTDLGDGTSLEEWKGGAETNKILGRGAGSAAPSRCRSTRSACASARCAATARR